MVLAPSSSAARSAMLSSLAVPPYFLGDPLRPRTYTSPSLSPPHRLDAFPVEPLKNGS